jgi:Tol biopolymer transport system component
MKDSRRALLDRCIALLLLGGMAWATAAAAQTSIRQKKRPSDLKQLPAEPTVFGEGVISTRDHESGTTFTPDGKTIYFTKSTPDLSFRVIVDSHFKDGKWSTPEVASFSGQYHDTDPCLSPDGNKLYFTSRRPVSGAAPKADTDIWMVEKTGNDWSELRNLGAPVNGESAESSPSVTADGTLYFSSNRKGGKGATDIYRSRLVDGKYLEPENLGDAINTPGPELQSSISPDERLLFFASAGREDGQGGLDLYLSVKRNGAWTKAVNLGKKINSSGNESAPSISPDGKYFFWTSMRGYGFETEQERRLTYPELLQRLRNARNSLGDIYRIDLSTLPLKQ